jgi:hypothetical protein
METIIAKLRLMHAEIDGQKRNAESLYIEVYRKLAVRQAAGGDCCNAGEALNNVRDALIKARFEVTRALGDLELALLIDALPVDASDAEYHHLCTGFKPSIQESRL